MNKSNNLKIFKVALDENVRKFTCCVFGFQKSVIVQAKSIVDLKSKMIMKLVLFLKVKNRVDLKCSQPMIKSEKKCPIKSKVDIQTDAQVKSEKKTIFNNIIDLKEKLYFRSESHLGKAIQKIDMVDGTDSTNSTMRLKLLQVIKLHTYDGNRLMNIDNMTLESMDYNILE